jgi:hypothetical protein
VPTEQQLPPAQPPFPTAPAVSKRATTAPSVGLTSLRSSAQHRNVRAARCGAQTATTMDQEAWAALEPLAGLVWVHPLPSLTKKRSFLFAESQLYDPEVGLVDGRKVRRCNRHLRRRRRRVRVDWGLDGLREVLEGGRKSEVTFSKLFNHRGEWCRPK